MNRKKNQSIILRFMPIMFLLILLVSFSRKPQGKGREVTDEAGRTVVIKAGIGSVVSLSPANTEILYAIGAGEKVTGVTDFCNYPPDVLPAETAGGFSDVNIEKVAQLNPDLILASHFHISRIVPALESLGFAVVVINPETVPAVFDSILFVGEICGTEIKAGSLVTELKSKYSALLEKVGEKESMSVYWELSDDFWTIGKGSYLDDLISKAGGQNIAKDLDAPWLQLSSEFIIHANPDIIFLADHPYGVRAGDLVQRPGWDSLSAVKNGRIIEVSTDMNDILSRPGPRVVQALEYIVKHFYPDLF